MVGVTNLRPRQRTALTSEQCVTMARIYHNQHEYCSDVPRLRKQGWKVVHVREQPVRLPIDHIRASCAGALIPCSIVELVAFYTRCGEPPRHPITATFIRRRH